MTSRLRVPFLSLFIVANAGAVDAAVTCKPEPAAVPKFGLVELAFTGAGPVQDPFRDVVIRVEFRSPSGRTIKIGGFPVSPELWKARLSADETGIWNYRWTFSRTGGTMESGGGTVECVPGSLPGYLRTDHARPFRWIHDDGSPFHPLGFQECIGEHGKTGTWLSAMNMEGPFRTDLRKPPVLPPGAMFTRGPSGGQVNGDVYFRAFRDAGFNLFRVSQSNCSPALYTDLDHWNLREAAMMDELLLHARRYGFRVMYGIFGYQQVLTSPDLASATPILDSRELDSVKRFVTYSADRWGALVDVWQFLNEQYAHATWFSVMGPHLKSVDPYRHPITTSWQQPELPGIEVNAPHWYQPSGAGDALARSCDVNVIYQAKEWKEAGKPVLVGETGNWIGEGKAEPGVGGVWDVNSALRYRIRNWSGTFEELGMVYWVTSYARDGNERNIWIGPLERQYARAMQDFRQVLGGGLAPATIECSDTTGTRSWALASAERMGVYLHHHADHRKPATGLTVTLNVPRSGAAAWYRPADGTIVATFYVESGARTLEVPPFAIDAALLINPVSLPDADGDGRSNDIDPDDDGDGVTDRRDAFPLDRMESADRDRDLIGDNLDADDDGNGKPDDDNRNGIPDWKEPDPDGDGVPTCCAVPWDAWPFDPKRWRAESKDTMTAP